MASERIIFEVDGQFAEDIRQASERSKPLGSTRPNVSAWVRLACAEKLERQRKWEKASAEDGVPS